MEQKPKVEGTSSGTSALDDGLGVVRSADNAAKARIWCALNKHEWPKELDSVKPSNWSELPHAEKQRISWELMCEAEDAIGIKECLREWNRETIPGEQFDAWWSNGRRPLATPNVMSPTKRRVNGICDSRIIWRSRLMCCILKQYIQSGLQSCRIILLTRFFHPIRLVCWIGFGPVCGLGITASAPKLHMWAGLNALSCFMASGIRPAWARPRWRRS